MQTSDGVFTVIMLTLDLQEKCQTLMKLLQRIKCPPFNQSQDCSNGLL